MAYETGKRIVDMVWEDLKPSDILTRKAFENAIVAASALGASTNCPPHINAIARHIGVKLDNADWDKIGYDIPLLVNCMPAGKYLGEAFHRAGGVPTVMARAPRQEEDPRRCAHRDRQDHGGEPRRRQAGRRRGDQDLRQADAGPGGLRRAVGQPVRLGDHEDLGDLARVPQEVPRAQGRQGRLRGHGDRVRRARGLSPPHQRSERCRSTRTASCSSATPARSAIPAPPRW